MEDSVLRSNKVLSGIILLAFFISPFQVGAKEIIGAEKIISRINKLTDEKKEPEKDKGQGEAKKLASDIDKFKAIRASLSPKKASSQWLKLYDRFWKLPPESLSKIARYEGMGNKNNLSLQSLLASVPPPKSWDALKKAVIKRSSSDKGMPETALRLMVLYLTHDEKKLTKTLEELKTRVKLSGQDSLYFLETLKMTDFNKNNRNNEKSVIEKFESYLASFESARPSGMVNIQVPDLLSLTDKKKATKLIVKALTIPGLRLNVPSGGKTLDLAKELTIKHEASLIEPQWTLITDTKDIKLYEVLSKRFPEKSKDDKKDNIFQENTPYSYDYYPDDEAKTRAKLIYILGLISKDRISEARDLAAEMKPADFMGKQFKALWQAFEKIRYTSQLIQFCSETLEKSPELPLWTHCGVLASSEKKAHKLLEIITKAANEEGLSLATKTGIEERKIDLLLAMDKIDDATRLLSRIIKSLLKESDPSLSPVKLKVASRMIYLGNLLEDKALAEEGEKHYLRLIKEQGPSMESYMYSIGRRNDPLFTIIDKRLEKKDYDGAEEILLLTMESVIKSAIQSQGPMIIKSGMGTSLPAFMTKLALIYDAAGRHEEILVLLEEAPWWGASDLVEIADSNRELIPLAAKALYKVGRKSEASKLLKNHLYGYPHDDDTYKVLVEMEGPSLIGWLDKLYLRDRFEERPLIWKAYLLNKAGKHEDAEKAVRQALKVDPTDGEQKAGNRVRGYAILADILKERGQEEDAAFFKRVVKAVRLAEKGDQFTRAGLVKRSFDIYREASLLFKDAYCIQWRMAERLSSMGDVEGAKKHYEIAFRRMPEQFGQVASFCFGCEGVFRHEQSMSTAERILTELSESSPKKPQVQFLLGQLRLSQHRKLDAYKHFRKAAELDPDYLDAWEEAYKLRSAAYLSRQEMDKIVLHMIKLDPMQRHISLYQTEVYDLKGLWQTYEEHTPQAIEIPDHLLSLNASKKTLKELMDQFGKSSDYYFRGRMSNYRERREVPQPGYAVANDAFISQMMQYSMRSGAGNVYMHRD